LNLTTTNYTLRLDRRFSNELMCVPLRSPRKDHQPIFRNFFAILKKNSTILDRFWRFRNEFYKNRALKTLAQNLKSSS